MSTRRDREDPARLATLERRRAEMIAAHTGSPKMDILNPEAVTLSPAPGRGRVAVAKDGEVLYASPGALDRALADGWELAPNGDPAEDSPAALAPSATHEGDGELVEAAMRRALLLRVPRDTILSVVASAFDVDDSAAHELLRRFRIDPETGEEVS